MIDVSTLSYDTKHTSHFLYRTKSDLNMLYAFFSFSIQYSLANVTPSFSADARTNIDPLSKNPPENIYKQLNMEGMCA
jgi:hypothetical protein